MDPIPSWEEIRRGDTTDVYFRHTMEVLRKVGKDRAHVKAEAFVKRFPAGYDYGILTGMDEMLPLFSGQEVDVRAMEEGSLFFTGEPVLSVEGPYGAFCEMETAMLGILCQASGVATKASRIKHLAGEKTVLSFGARRMHPVLSTIIDRNAFIGGIDAVSVIRSAEYLGESPVGTMPHALILVLGDTVAALRAFDDAVDPAVPRVCLVDTLQDEKFEAVRAAETLGKKLAAVRLDTPASRRGNFRRLIQEVRWELDLRGFDHVRILASGGLGEEDIRDLLDVADGFGVGTCISNAPTIDFALDIVEVEGVPFAKRGKHSGGKQVVSCPSCSSRKVVPESAAKPRCACGAGMEGLLLLAMRRGEVLAACRSPRELRKRVLDRVARFHSRREEE
ncbi:MAG: nicotinate phosphoribosyltransferase [Deltaproteobacteria bacterium RBG_16_64_85]|nr:MAG: nicotinate phosphoribosyltransferase [Deltaproteobacteria bacterium RBG_16_64_85]